MRYKHSRRAARHFMRVKSGTALMGKITWKPSHFWKWDGPSRPTEIRSDATEADISIVQCNDVTYYTYDDSWDNNCQSCWQLFNDSLKCTSKYCIHDWICHFNPSVVLALYAVLLDVYSRTCLPQCTIMTIIIIINRSYIPREVYLRVPTRLRCWVNSAISSINCLTSQKAPANQKNIKTWINTFACKSAETKQKKTNYGNY